MKTRFATFKMDVISKNETLFRCFISFCGLSFNAR
ncbi:hypothetical protein ESA_00450 [Cronobacter sakazakii ATCC BAA-894]|uniref:Uncharacterized protein n=1 Tax=Cronobacter sakazakii (strain ATCC BAA-894) TaxID=290339 RepID=A7MR58_CROS8|nr:hypothetical protein ESA_00450 [Cronobacter sakazakii ATCC BAA-894]